MKHMKDSIAARQPEPEQNVSGIRVFVYGTLKLGHYNHDVLAASDAEYLGRCFIEGFYRMINLSAYPGLIKTDGLADATARRIFGEVYRVNQSGLDALDILEGNGRFYTRSKIKTPWKNTWAYFLPTTYGVERRAIDEGVWKPTEDETRFWHPDADRGC